METNHKLKFLSFVNLGLFSFITIIIFLNSPNLRPIADDYCHAINASNGLFAYFNYWFFTWNSEITNLIVNYFILGFPLLYFPYSFASSIAFISVLFSLTFLFIFLFGLKFNFKNLLISTSFISVSYLGFWSTSNLFFPESLFRKLSNSIVHWQTINGFYILPFIFSTVAAVWVIRNFANRKKRTIIFILLGFVLSTSGLLLSIVFLIYFIIFYLSNSIRVKSLINQNLLVLLFTILFGILVNFFSPGTQTRSKALQPGWINPTNDPLQYILWIFPKAPIEFLQGFFHAGSIFVLLIGLISYIVFHHFNVEINILYINQVLFFSITLAFISTFISQLSEAFAYEAFWHLILPYFFIYIFFFSFGFLIGFNLLNSHNLFLLYFVISIIISMVTLLNVKFLIDEIEVRKIDWQKGPAALGEIGDIFPSDGWINGCWSKLYELKKYPNRK